MLEKRLFGLWLALAAASPATAAPMETVSANVTYTDLDLSNAAQLARLERRIVRAARALCLPDRHYNLSPAALPDSGCVNDAVAAARREVSAAVAAQNLPGRRSTEVVARER